MSCRIAHARILFVHAGAVRTAGLNNIVRVSSLCRLLIGTIEGANKKVGRMFWKVLTLVAVAPVFLVTCWGVWALARAKAPDDSVPFDGV